MKKSGLHLILICMIPVIFSAGCKSFNLRIADNYYSQYAYAKAIPKYEKVLKKEFIPQAASRIAESYRKTGNSQMAEVWYKRLVSNPMVTPQDKLDLAEVLMENGKYEEAKGWFHGYLELNSGDKRVRRMLQATDSIHLFFEDTTVYTVAPLKINKNDESNFSPAFYRDGIVFLSDRPAPGKLGVKSEWTGKEYLDLFYARRIDSTNWTEPELLKGDINGRFDEGPAAFADDFTTIYFTRNDYYGKNIETNQRNESNLKLYHGKVNGNIWELRGPLTFNNADYSVGHPTLTVDGKTMFFVSDMPWGYGGTDIYTTSFENGSWTEPVNLGANVNTEGNEMFPFIARDSVLYFASDGHIGLGGLDIFSSYYNGEKWSVPENLQYPVNSSKDDFGFIIDSLDARGYFSSNRSKNTDKLYGFYKNPPVFTLELHVTDRKKKPVSDFAVQVANKNGNLKLLATGSKGFSNIRLNRNTNYDLLVQSKGYYTAKINATTTGLRKSTVLVDTLVMDKIELNKAIVWKSIDFTKRESVINTNAAKGLDSLANILQLNPEIQIEVASHTDSRGTFSENISLSNKRAEAITGYLVSKGISSHRIVTMGYGEAKLLNNCRDGILCLEEDHQINNRIEIKVVGYVK